MLKGFLLGAGVFLVGLVLGWVLLAKPVAPVIIGGAAGTEHSQFENFYDGIAIGGSVITYTATSTPMTAQEFCSNRTVNVAATTVGNGNFTLASTTGVFSRCLPMLGMSIVTYFRNTSTTGNITIVGGDSSSSVQTLLVSSTAPQASTSSITAGWTGKITSLRSISSTQPWLYHILEVYK